MFHVCPHQKDPWSWYNYLPKIDDKNHKTKRLGTYTVETSHGSVLETPQTLNRSLTVAVTIQKGQVCRIARSWWFQRCFLLHPNFLGEMIHFDEHVLSNGLVQPPTTLRITGLCYRGFWMCIAGVWDLQTTSFEIP